MNLTTQNLLPNAAILKSTFNIFYKDKNCTAFIVNGSKGQYLITAKHLFDNTIKEGTLVDIIIKGGQIDEEINCDIFYHDNTAIDIAVLKLNSNVISGEILQLKESGSYYLAQQCLFLGFPLFNLGTVTDIGKVAFVKRAIISAFHEENNIRIMLLDGQNNLGFSGGPVITYNETMDTQFIIGVVSGYINQQNNIEIKNGEINNTIQIAENSGIIITYNSEYIIEIINKIEKK
jgi:hypothetical protein